MGIIQRRRIRPVARAVETPPQPPAPAVEESPAPSSSDNAGRVDYVAVIQRYAERVTNRTSAIRAKCIECSGGVISEVRNCPITKCALYPFRNGDDPFRKKRTDGFAGRKGQDQEED